MGNLRNNKTDEEWEALQNEANESQKETKFATIEEIGKEIAEAEGTNEQKMASFLFVVCNNDMELYARTVDLLANIDKFKKLLLI